MELVRRAAAGSERAMHQLADRLLNSVRATVHYLAAKDSDADDLAQLSMIEILRAVHSFRGECRLETWATRIAVRTTMRHLKRRRRGISWLTHFRDNPLEQPASPDQISETLQMRRRVQQILCRLPLSQRTALVLKLVHGFSIEEISDVTDAPPNTVRERLRVARMKFRTYTLKDPVLSEWGKGRLQ